MNESQAADQWATLPEEARTILDKRVLAHVATLLPDGSPQVTPTWIGREDDLVVINTAEGRLKLRNLRRDPRVSICATDPDDDFTYVAIQGRAVEITATGADEHVDSLAMKYTGEKFPRGREADENRVVIRIAARRVVVVSDA